MTTSSPPPIVGSMTCTDLSVCVPSSFSMASPAPTFTPHLYVSPDFIVKKNGKEYIRFETSDGRKFLVPIMRDTEKTK